MFDFMKPKCPRFPDASLCIGRMSGWLYSFLAWLGLRLGWVGRPLLRLASRARDVEWSRRPLEERMKVMCMVASIGIVGAFIALGGGMGSRTARPAWRKYST